MPATSTAVPSTRLMMPRPSLTSCVRAYILRSTVEAPLADPAQRLNHFPASPLCSITWLIEGDSVMIAPPPPGPHDPGCRVWLGGPQTQPITTYNPGPVRTFGLMLYPQALHALSGITVADCVDSWYPLEQVCDPQWQAMSAAVLAARDDASRIAAIEDFLEPRWRQARTNPDGGIAGMAGMAGGMAGDWVRHLATQAAATGLGRGVRHIERRIKAWAGLSMRTLRRLQRGEATFLEARGVLEGDKMCWADVAARAGYADQAHFCRETRKITGLSPAELARAGQHEESYWIYRIWY